MLHFPVLNLPGCSSGFHSYFMAHGSQSFQHVECSTHKIIFAKQRKIIFIKFLICDRCWTKHFACDFISFNVFLTSQSAWLTWNMWHSNLCPDWMWMIIMMVTMMALGFDISSAGTPISTSTITGLFINSPLYI